MSNPNYDNLITFAAEQALTKKMHLIWSASNPLLAMLIGNKTNFNKGFSIEGHKAILPINFAEQSTPADGVADSGELTPITPYVTSGFTQAEYQFSHYRAAMYLRNSEKKLIAGPSARGNILEAKVNQLMESFNKGVVGDLWSATNGSREAVIGLRYVLSTTNSPGNISQSSYPVWAAQRTTGAGPFHLGLADSEYDRIVSLGRGKPDLLNLSYTASNNVYGKMRDSIAPSQLITNAGWEAKYGFVSFAYLDMMCVQENRLGEALGGSFTMLRTGAWYFGAETLKPNLDHVTPVVGTDAEERFYNWWLMVGCNDPATNALVDGIQ